MVFVRQNENAPLSTPSSSDAPHVLHAKPQVPPKGPHVHQKKCVKVKRDCHSTLRLASSSCITLRSSCECLLRSARSTSAVAARAAQYRATDDSGVGREAVTFPDPNLGKGFPVEEGTNERP